MRSIAFNRGHSGVLVPTTVPYRRRPATPGVRRNQLRQGARNKHDGQRLEPESFGGFGGTSPHAASPKDGDSNSESELNHVQSTRPECRERKPLVY